MTASSSPARGALGGYLMVIAAATSWGCWPFILRHAERFGPVDARLESAVVMITLTLVTLPLALRSRGASRRRTAAGWLGVAWLGVSDALNVVLLFTAYRTTSVSIAVLTHYLTPVLVAVAAPLVLAERATRTTLLSVVVAVLGLLLLLRPWEVSAAPHDALGAAFGAGSAVFYASNVLVNKRLAGGFTPAELMGYHGVVAAPLLAALVPAAAWHAVAWPSLGVLVLGGLGPGAIAGLLFVGALHRVPASHASTLTLLEPLVAVLFAVVTLHERLSVLAVVGAAMILGGAVAVMRQAPT